MNPTLSEINTYCTLLQGMISRELFNGVPPRLADALRGLEREVIRVRYLVRVCKSLECFEEGRLDDLPSSER